MRPKLRFSFFKLPFSGQFKAKQKENPPTGPSGKPGIALYFSTKSTKKDTYGPSALKSLPALPVPSPYATALPRAGLLQRPERCEALGVEAEDHGGGAGDGGGPDLTNGTSVPSWAMGMNDRIWVNHQISRA